MTSTTILWRRVDQPGYEFARLLSDESTFRLAGTAVFLHDGKPCRIEYNVECGNDWETRLVTVGGWIGSEEIDVELSVDSANRWRINGEDNPAVDGCFDIDLNFSPATNLLPIRRLGLAVEQQAEAKAAWLRFPSFNLEAIEQLYSRVSDSSYRYASAGFSAELEVDESGFVISYPGYWETEAIT